MFKDSIENEVVGYVDGKAIIRDEEGRWFFLEISEELITPGEQIMTEDLTPVDNLPESIIKLILTDMEVI